MATSLSWTNTLITDKIEDKKFASMLELENENTLTIDVIIPHVFNLYKDIQNKRVMILKAGTGSGKSSTFPYHLWKYFDLNHGSLLVAQPRRNTNQANSTFVASIYGLTMGKEIGYRHGVGAVMPSEPWNILYITHQIINNLILSNSVEKFTSKYPVVILDEMHESSSEIDLIYFLVRDFIKKGCKSLFIFTSATLNEKKIAKYFDISVNIFPLFIHVKGNDENMKVNMFTPDDNDRDIIRYLKNALEKTFIFGKYSKNLETISRMNENNVPLIDTVIFCPTQMFINNFMKIVTEMFKEEINNKNIIVISYKSADSTYNTVNEKIYQKMNDDYERTTSLIVIGTTVLETGITVRRLNTVIDTCLKNDKIELVVGGFSKMIVQPISESELLQRRGRAGRVGEGNYYSFYSEKSISFINEHEEIPGAKYPIPKTFTTKDFALNIILMYYQTMAINQLYKDGIGEYLQDMPFDKLLELSKKIKPLYVEFDMINTVPFDIYIESFNYLFKHNLLNSNFSLSVNGLISKYFDNKIVMISLLIKYLLQKINPIDIVWILSLLDKYENFDFKFVMGISRQIQTKTLIEALKNIVKKNLKFEPLIEKDYEIININVWGDIQKNFIDVFSTVYSFVNRFNFMQNNLFPSYFKGEIDILDIDFTF